MEHWEFFTQRVSGADYTEWRWKWRRMKSDGTSLESTESFTTLKVCVQDARKNGYTGKDPALGGGWFDKPQSKYV